MLTGSHTRTYMHTYVHLPAHHPATQSHKHGATRSKVKAGGLGPRKAVISVVTTLQGSQNIALPETRRGS